MSKDIDLCIGHRMLLVLKNTLRHQLHAHRGSHTRACTLLFCRKPDRSLALNVLAMFKLTFSVLHTAACMTCAIPAATVARVGPPLVKGT